MFSAWDLYRLYGYLILPLLGFRQQKAKSTPLPTKWNALCTGPGLGVLADSIAVPLGSETFPLLTPRIGVRNACASFFFSMHNSNVANC